MLYVLPLVVCVFVGYVHAHLCADEIKIRLCSDDYLTVSLSTDGEMQPRDLMEYVFEQEANNIQKPTEDSEVVHGTYVELEHHLAFMPNGVLDISQENAYLAKPSNNFDAHDTYRRHLMSHCVFATIHSEECSEDGYFLFEVYNKGGPGMLYGGVMYDVDERKEENDWFVTSDDEKMCYSIESLWSYPKECNNGVKYSDDNKVTGKPVEVNCQNSVRVRKENYKACKDGVNYEFWNGFVSAYDSEIRGDLEVGDLPGNPTPIWAYGDFYEPQDSDATCKDVLYIKTLYKMKFDCLGLNDVNKIGQAYLANPKAFKRHFESYNPVRSPWVPPSQAFSTFEEGWYVTLNVWMAIAVVSGTLNFLLVVAYFGRKYIRNAALQNKNQMVTKMQDFKQYESATNKDLDDGDLVQIKA